MTPRTVSPGQIISEPGVYDIPIERYHQQCCIGPSISSSGLRAIENGTLAHFYDGWSGNPNAEPITSKALDFGKAAHALIRGDDHFDEHFACAPFTNWNTNETIQFDGREVTWFTVPLKDKRKARPGPIKSIWKAEQESADKTIIMPDAMAKIRDMKKALAREPMVQQDLLDGQSEVSLFWQDEETGIWLKARPDLVPLSAWVSDYKTTVSAARWRTEKDVFNYGYHMQLALVAEGMAALDLIPRNGRGEHEALTFSLILQESTRPYAVVPQEIAPDAIWQGARQNRHALRLFAECLKSGEWPGYDMPPPISTPDWLAQRLDENAYPDPPAAFQTILGKEE